MKNQIAVASSVVSLLPLSEHVEIIERGKKAISDIPAIFDQDSYAKAVEVVQRGKKLIKLVGDTVNELTRPFKDAKKSLDEAQNEIKKEADTMLGDFVRALGDLESNCLLYLNEQRRIEAELKEQQAKQLAEANAKIAEAAEKNELTQEIIEEVMAPIVVVPVTEKPKGMRKIWKYEVLNADLVPREYCDPTPGKIQKAVQEGLRDIPGVRIYEHESL